MNLRFLGGAGTVTGSRYLLEGSHGKVLIDCGLFQGLKALRMKNWEQFPVPAHEISAVFLTHAHLDHSGFLPRLVNEGYKGKIFASHATRDLCRILLMDSAKIQEEEARYANRHAYSKHRPALPLYTTEDVKATLERFVAVEFSKPFECAGFSIEYTHAGHILGASSIQISQAKVRVTFSGDVGRLNDAIMKPPANLSQTDYLIVESTYGNRKHPQTDGLNRLKESVLEIVQSGGTLLIPAFTVGRAQQIMYAISQLKSGNLIPDIPIFLNSPMAINVCDLYSHYANEHKIGKEALRKMFDGVNYISSAEDSKALNKERGVRVIISASGMATGGRVLFHLEELAPDPRNQILFAGYQAAGTRGSTLVSGCDEIKIHGQYVPVRAKVKNLDSFSAHADYQEILDWLGRSRLNPKRVFICHGEPEASDAMRRRIEERFHWPCTIPQVQDSWELT